MSDDEDDYMSDKFLSGLQEVRPSLIHNRAKKREIEVQKKQVEHNKRQRNALASTASDNAKLQEKLSQPLPAENKGFQLLAKMGYKPGSGLGKQTNAITEPIAISIKNDRGGLGREAAIDELNKKRSELRRIHLLRKAGIDSTEEITTEAYRRRVNQKAEERKLNYDIKRCQQTCESLDIAGDIKEPELEFFWPPKPKETEEESEEAEEPEEEEETDQYTQSEQLDLLTSYLRTAYTFCYWCGTRYESKSDLEANCPGETRDDH